MVVSLNSRLESNKEEEAETLRSINRSGSLVDMVDVRVVGIWFESS